MSGRRTKALRDEYRKLPAADRGRKLFIDAAGTLRGNRFRDFKHGRQAEARERALFLIRCDEYRRWVRLNNDRIATGVARSRERRLAGAAA